MTPDEEIALSVARAHRKCARRALASVDRKSPMSFPVPPARIWDAVNLFAGPGGTCEGARSLGLDVIGLEKDDSACDTREAAGHPTVRGDVTKLHPRDFPARGLLGSPPCQTFSMAGGGAGRRALAEIEFGIWCVLHGVPWWSDGDPRTMLVLEPLRWIVQAFELFRPHEWIALEQVATVLPVWQMYARVLRALGYSVEVGVLHAEQFGVPQTRKRAILVAKLHGAAALPVPTHSRYYPRDRERLDPGVLPWVSMAQALGHGMTARPSITVTCGGTATGGAEPFGNGARKGMYREIEAGHWAFDRPATTVNCDPRIAAPGRHDPARPGSQYGPGTIRATQRELAILQTFPEDYPWRGTKGKQGEQVGNAVPPLLARAIISAVTS